MTELKRQALTDQEVRRFKRDGYLIKRGLLDPELCAACRDLMWTKNEVTRIVRDDPASHVGRFTKDEENTDAGNLRKGFNWRSRSLGTEQPFLDLLPQNPRVIAIAEELMGPGTVAPSNSTGGVYAVMPKDPGVRNPRPAQQELGLHVDSSLESRERIGLVGYIDDVPPGGGAFAVWPRSHLRCWNLLRDSADKLHQANKEVGAADLRALAGTPYTMQMKVEFDRIKADTWPVDCYGSVGDCIFYHERLGHHAGLNYSATIRQAVLTRLSKTADSVPDPLVDVRAGDIWLTWSDRLQQIDSGGVALDRTAKL